MHPMPSAIDLTINFCGVRAPNPFWLASAPPTNSAYQLRRAFEAGWGGAVWKTFGHDPPIVNTASRYGAVDYDGRKVMGLNNIELISDRPMEVNLREIRDIKREFPDRALFVSLMVESKREAWHDIVMRAEDTGADGIELNFGCPHGMSERGMGAAVGQVPEYTCMIVEWVKEVARTPVMVKLTPNISDVRAAGRAAKRGGADAVSLINTINSIMGVDLDTFSPKPQVGGYGSHGGYCGPAVKPIALNMVSQIATDPDIGLPISGIGGIQAWQDAAEFLLLGAGSVQVCTAVMHYGFRIVQQLSDGLTGWMRSKGFTRIGDFQGKSVERIRDWGDLDLNYKVVAEIDPLKCINCGLCYIACEDGCHQSISRTPVPEAEFVRQMGPDAARRVFTSGTHHYTHGAGEGYVNVYAIKQDTCVGCNMCSLICPVEGCISMKRMDTGRPPMSWRQYQRLLAEGKIAPIQPPEHV
ncbi:NAD-dependent dihydropyrimidine dehydrogenase subunit PreA [Phycisphaerae bacterium RAS1]|nr:NAD-dependent dihydropyrimidine dehydrogenase subunit PreA [Phycisphaerae bacterium RAS1]